MFEDLKIRTLEELAERCKSEAGDNAAFSELFRRLKTLIYWRMRSQLPKAFKHYADDLTQEAFLRMSQKIKAFETGRPFLPWFRTVADNICRDYIRKIAAEAATVVSELNPGAVRDIVCDSQIDEGDVRRRLHAMLKHFSDPLERGFVVELCTAELYGGRVEIDAIARRFGFAKTKGYELRRQMLERLRHGF